MDQSRFDSLTRTFATSRRQALKLALGGVVAALAGSTGGASAARRGFPGFNPFQPNTCTIDNATWQANDLNPRNPCQFCDPGLDKTGWSPNSGAFCGDGTRACCNGDCCAATHCCGFDESCTPCRCEIDGVLVGDGIPNPAHDCQVCEPATSTSSWTPTADISACGGVPGRVCCNGDCCSPTECRNGISCEECGPHCVIGGIEIDAETPNPQNECEICDPARAIDAWSNATEGIACNSGDGCCSAGECGACSCVIDGDPVPDRTDNPHNDCQECIYARDPNDWSNRANGSSCGNNNDRDCCDGECCQENSCCTVDGCELCCRITSEPVADGVVNPRNTCQVCDAAHDGRNWTTLDDGEACGATGNSECCNGECCPSGQCCRDGQCGLCDCEIGGRRFSPDTINENNPCEICKPARNRFDWSAVGTGTTCDAQGGTCCGRDCCADDLCCLLDACGECLCSIENVIFDPQDRNAQNTCQICDPHADPFAWTTVPDRGSCGPTGDQQCCNGFCCDPGQCCLGGACRPCGCFIDGQEIGSGAPNPANECQYCNPETSTDAWTSSADGELCGETPAECCQAGACTICGCLIGGQGFIDGEQNPNNECQQCDHALDPNGWSPRNETFRCDTGGDGVCCNGACCSAGFVCNLDDTCTLPGCLIDGQQVAANSHNPLNDCQVCLPDESETAWTLLGDGAACGDTGAQCCAAGICQNCGCLIDGFPRTNGEPNPDNECQQCDAALDPSGWSNRGETFPCGEAEDGVCCGGICCPAGNTCDLDDICVPPGCVIDGVNYEDGTVRPRERCDICDAANDPTDWTPRLIPDCPPPCTIGGVIMRYGTVNPDNPCQICHGGDDWSPSSALFCGDGTQVCCNGACCDSGACCSAEGVCGSDNCEQQGCVIDGVQYEDGAENPVNACQVCTISNSTSDWTPQFGQCGENFDRFCCEGVCCDLGACCNPDQVCDFDTCQTCAIDGVLDFPEDRNPANTCEMCLSNQNKFAWTPLPDNFFCDEIQLTVCCNGSCCNAGESCIGGGCVPA